MRRVSPPASKAVCGGQGVLEGTSTPLLPSELVDRTKGHFLVPGIHRQCAVLRAEPNTDHAGLKRVGRARDVAAELGGRR
jgi:asparagine synthase (glutamine-hydrolysing)